MHRNQPQFFTYPSIWLLSLLQAAQSLLSFGACNDEAQNISLAPAPLPTPIPPSSLVSLANNKGSTALHFLCYADSQSETSLLLAEALLAAGSDVNAKDCRGMTPFLVCCTKGRYRYDTHNFSHFLPFNLHHLHSDCVGTLHFSVDLIGSGCS